MSFFSDTQITRYYGPSALTSFNEAREHAVAYASQEIKNAKESGANLRKLFHEVTDQLAQRRNHLADLSRTPNPVYFGRPRKYTSGSVFHTNLGSSDPANARYQTHNRKIMQNIQRILQGNIPASGPLTQKKFQINSFYQGRSTRFEIELLDKKDIIAREWTKPVHSKTVNILPHIKFDLDTDSMDRPNFPSTDKDHITLKDFHQNQMTIKANFPDVYVHEKMNYLLSAIDNCFPLRELKVIPGTSTTQFVKNELNIRSIYVVAKVSCEFNSKLYALSKYITWTHQDNETDPVERMTDIPVLILHQDLYLLDDTLKEISTIFERALRWNKKEDPIEDLINEVGILRYLFTHAMPYIRGSSAIGEWLEESIYKSHDLNFERRPGQSADLEALTAPTLDKFMNRHYKHTIWVSEPINDVKETV